MWYGSWRIMIGVEKKVGKSQEVQQISGFSAYLCCPAIPLFKVASLKTVALESC